MCAVLGGIIANNVVAGVSASSAPINNLLYYSLFDTRAIVEQRPSTAAAAPGAKAGAAQQVEAAVVLD